MGLFRGAVCFFKGHDWRNRPTWGFCRRCGLVWRLDGADRAGGSAVMAVRNGRTDPPAPAKAEEE